MKAAAARAPFENACRHGSNSCHPDCFMSSPALHVTSENAEHVTGHDIQDAWSRRRWPSMKYHGAHSAGEINNTRSNFDVRNVTFTTGNWGLTCSFQG